MGFQDLADGVLEACKGTFGETVSYTPAGGSAESITGIFNAKTQVVEDGLPVILDQPNLGVVLADLSSAPRVGDTVVVRGVSYRVSNVENDGEGGSVLSLQKAS